MASQKRPAKAKLAVIEFCNPIELPPERYELVASFTVLGEPGRKSNQRRIVTNRYTGKPMIIKGEKAMRYIEAFERQIPKEYRTLQVGSAEQPLALWAQIWYASNRPDLSSELLMDLLEKNGIVANDRWIKAQFLFGAIDKENPRTDIRLYKVL